MGKRIIRERPRWKGNVWVGETQKGFTRNSQQSQDVVSRSIGGSIRNPSSTAIRLPEDTFPHRHDQDKHYLGKVTLN